VALAGSRISWNVLRWLEPADHPVIEMGTDAEVGHVPPAPGPAARRLPREAPAAHERRRLAPDVTPLCRADRRPSRTAAAHESGDGDDRRDVGEHEQEVGGDGRPIVPSTLAQARRSRTQRCAGRPEWCPTSEDHRRQGDVTLPEEMSLPNEPTEPIVSEAPRCGDEAAQDHVAVPRPEHPYTHGVGRRRVLTDGPDPQPQRVLNSRCARVPCGVGDVEKIVESNRIGPDDRYVAEIGILIELKVAVSSAGSNGTSSWS